MADTEPSTGPLLIPGPAGDLEALIEGPTATARRGVAVVCHPHPLHGGALTNKVAHTLARSARALGLVALRFNFRGVGKSTGRFDEGRGETEDLLAVVEWIREGFGPDVILWLAGFSFGAGVTLRATGVVKPAQLITIAPAVRPELTDDFVQPECPWLVAIGDDDELVDCEALIEWINKLEPGPELIVFEDGDHFFHGRLVELKENLVNSLRLRAEEIPLADLRDA